MNMVLPVKLVPDLVEELVIDVAGTALDASYLRWKLNEFDDHAIEQAILLKESLGGQVTVITPDLDGADEALYTAAAKGADRLIKITGEFETAINNHALARWLVPLIKELQPDLVLTGVQAYDDLDGSLGPLLAEFLGLPFLGYVAGISIEGMNARLRKEYPGGLVAEMEMCLPAVFGIQAAEHPPRYVAFSKIRQMMKSITIEERPWREPDPSGRLTVRRLFLPESGEHATMMEGDVDEIVTRLVGIFQDTDLI
jgi:electron transfer flavoprotein beta subunit